MGGLTHCKGLVGGLGFEPRLAESESALQSNTSNYLTKPESVKPLKASQRVSHPLANFPGTSYVYVVAARPYIKIGVANDPFARARDIQVGCPLRCCLVYRLRVDTAIRDTVEANAHKILAKRAERGEWFRAKDYQGYEAVLKALTQTTGLPVDPALDEVWGTNDGGHWIRSEAEQEAQELIRLGVFRALGMPPGFKVETWTAEHFVNGQRIATPIPRAL